MTATIENPTALAPLTGELGPFKFSERGLEISGELTREQWQACGKAIRAPGRAVLWWIGDWLNCAERRWGEMYTEAVELTGLSCQTLRHCKVVAAKFDLCRRRHNLEFSHHYEVVALPVAIAEEILDTAADEGLSKKDVRKLANQAKAAQAVGCVSPTSTDEKGMTVTDLAGLVQEGRTFGTIYADPPWRYGNQGTRAATGNHYDGDMSLGDIAALPVGKLAAPKSHLWLWTTNAFLFECPRLFAAWGFEFKSSYIWVKPQIGIGNYIRNSHEFLLLAVRGGLVGQAKNVRSWGEFRRGEHSAKPEAIRVDVIERLSPGPRLELFARQTAPGWTCWGNQVAGTLLDQLEVGEEGAGK